MPPRLGWWQTDLIDPAGGGDFFGRLLPRTQAWASLEAVREAARRIDEQGRRGLAEPDLVRTLFFQGFDLDERVSERLAELKRAGVAPSAALRLLVPLDAPFSTEGFAEALRGGGRKPASEIVPGGRQLKGAMPEALELVAQTLGAALVPFAEHYPMPFYRVKA